MEPFEENNSNESDHREIGARTSIWLRPALVALLAISVLATVYGVHERSQAAMTSNSMNQLQAQVNALTAKLNEASPAQTQASPTVPPAESLTSTTPASVAEANTDQSAPAPVLPAAAAAKSTPAKHTTVKHRTVDKRYSQLKSQLDEQQKQLKDTQDQVAKNRAELEGSISSTRDELSGSIAKTHEELVTLEKRGERSYFEFDLTKSKQFQRFGPLTLSLRKADTKHKNYDLAMIVDDNELNKKKVNLYEPIWIHTENGRQPIQVVVNRIEKNLVHGYVSAPKYKQSELATLSSPATPAPDSAQASSQPR
jgi:uncharacterized coiled-coil protein SlyX